MDITMIIGILALLIGIADFLLIRSTKETLSKLNQKIEEREKTIILNDILIPFKHTGGNPETIEDSIRNIARVIKEGLVAKYKIKNPATVRELVEEIETLSIEPDLKKELLDFFDNVAYAIYSDDVSEESVKKIRNEALDLISRLQLRIPTKQKIRK